MIDQRSGRVVVESLEVADTFWRRLRGLQFRRSFPMGSGLLLTRCTSIHTCCVRFPIDVVMLDEDGKVLAIRANLRPWRMVTGAKGTCAILEVPASTATMQVGDVLKVVTEP
jgi:uncharacterized membrane protein (UPF0127 family)